MKQILIIGIIAAVFTACGNTASAPLVPDDYRSWSKTIDAVLEYPIAGHGQSLRVIYINDKGKDTVPVIKNGRMTYNYPDGTIIVKEVYPVKEDFDRGNPGMLTVMVKDTTSPLAINGWLWIVKTPGENIENVFPSKFCLECHLDANESHLLGEGNKNKEFRDYVFFPYLSYKSKERGNDREAY